MSERTIAFKTGYRFAGTTEVAFGLWSTKTAQDILLSDLPLILKAPMVGYMTVTSLAFLADGLVSLIRGSQFELPLRVWRALERDSQKRQKLDETVSNMVNRKDQRLPLPRLSFPFRFSGHNPAA